MNRITRKDDLIDQLAQRTGFFKKNMVEVVNALEDIILESLETATFEENSELHLRPGVVIKGRRVPAHEVVDPRTQEIVISPEKVIPSAVFKQSIRQKLYVRPKSKKKG